MKWFKNWRNARHEKAKACRHDWQLQEYLCLDKIEYSGYQCSLCQKRHTTVVPWKGVSYPEFYISAVLSTLFKEWQMGKVHSIAMSQDNKNFTFFRTNPTNVQNPLPPTPAPKKKPTPNANIHLVKNT